MNKILNVYLYGSHVYGTANKESDTDYIFVVDHQRDKEAQIFAGKYDITAYPVDYFQKNLYEHKVSALECFFLPQELKIELHKFHFELDVKKLRRSFSAKASNSWVRAKKKIDLHQEFYLGMKSLFHALRILSFGIQIAEFGKITKWEVANSTWNKIKNQDFKTWQEYKEFWQPEYNRLKSMFKVAAPIEKGDKDVTE